MVESSKQINTNSSQQGQNPKKSSQDLGLQFFRDMIVEICEQVISTDRDQLIMHADYNLFPNKQLPSLDESLQIVGMIK